MNLVPKVNKKYQKLIPRHTKFENSALFNSLKDKGQLNDIEVSQLTGNIVDGYERLPLLKKLKLTIKYHWRDFKNEDEELIFVIENNIRRNLNDVQKAKLALLLLPLETKKAKLRQKHGRGQKVSSIELKGQARDVVAKKSGLSPATFHRIRSVLESKNKKLIAQLESGKISSFRAYTMLKVTKRRIIEPELPKDKYSVILCDPPLKWDKELRGSATEKYQTYTLEKFLELFPADKMPFADNCILFIWSWPGRTREIQKIIDHWGFNEITRAVWVKLDQKGKIKMGMGSRFRLAHEDLVLCEKGKMPGIATDKRPLSVIMAQYYGHSVKPSIVNKMIMSMYPNQKYCELFARQKRSGWKYFGNEQI